MAGKTVKISGPLIIAENMADSKMYDVVRVSDKGLIGEVIELRGDKASIQVYEETSGLGPGEDVYSTGEPLSAELAPGLITGIFDGIQRPLTALYFKYGDRISRGVSVNNLDREKKWHFIPAVQAGATLSEGDVLGVVWETEIVEHRIMVPHGMKGKVVSISEGDYTIEETVAVLETEKGNMPVCMLRKWPVRKGRPYREKLSPDKPMVTGQRVIDTLFPIAKGGTAAIPGGFGTGKTMTQHQIAKWSNADIIIYIGCGERGNEMSQVLEEFSELIDPKSQRPMTDRTVLIANTSNMPVAAREASIYTGITLGEYYRDMGYHVAMMADSTSRWAEALREISGRLEEMPAEEGFPAYLPSRLAEFYERGGRAEVLSGGEGSVTLIGAVSPQGSDFSEPVTQNTKRFTRCFWALDKALAYSRHYPAINWMDSYSEYFNDLDPWFRENLGEDFIEYRNRISALLQEESSLMEIVKLIGSDVLPDDQKLVIETARVIRVGFLQQNAFHADDTYVPLEKQKLMMKTILHLHAKAKDIVAQNIPLSKILNLGLFDKLTKMKYDIPNSKPEMFDDYIKEIDEKLAAIS